MPRIAAAEDNEERRKRRIIADRRQAEPEHAARQPSQLGKFGDQIIATGQNRESTAIDHFAGIGQRRAMAIRLSRGRPSSSSNWRTALLTAD